MQNSKKAFTMIEMVFVIVVLGILASIAIPKLAATRTDAQITKGIADVSSIRSGIVTERQSRLITGDSTWIANGTGTGQMDGGSGDFFGGVMMYGVSASTTDGWSGTAGSGSYDFKIGSVTCGFTYDEDTGKFTLDGSQDSLCDNLVK